MCLGDNKINVYLKEQFVLLTLSVVRETLDVPVKQKMQLLSFFSPNEPKKLTFPNCQALCSFCVCVYV